MSEAVVNERGPVGPRRRSNLRTALILASIAAVFFIGVIVNRFFIVN